MTKAIEQVYQVIIDCGAEVLATDARTCAGWTQIWKTISCQLRSERLEGNERKLELIRRTISNQHLVAKRMRKVEQAGDREIDLLHRHLDKLHLDSPVGEASGMMPKMDDPQYHGVAEEISSQNRPTSVPNPEDADNHLRAWFLSNITLPFADKPAKRNLASLTGMDNRQINTWFTNMRRRSGYTDLMRKYADGDKERFAELCKDAERGEGPEGLGEALIEMRRYVGRKPKGDVGEWLLNVS